jgi:hypothetical protein
MGSTQRKVYEEEKSGMYIQFAGFTVAENSRIYTFKVLDTAKVQREFTVRIPSDTNHWANLKLQDGPAICFERLEKELVGETTVALGQTELSITEQDIQEYLKRHYPQPKPKVFKPAADESDGAPENTHAAAAGPDNYRRW